MPFVSVPGLLELYHQWWLLSLYDMMGWYSPVWLAKYIVVVHCIEFNDMGPDNNGVELINK